MMMKCIRRSLLLFNGERVTEGQTFDAPEPYASDYINGKIAVRVAEPARANDPVPPVYPEDSVATQTEPETPDDAAGSPKVGKKKGR